MLRRGRLLLHLASALAVWASCTLATPSHGQRLRQLDGGVVSLTDLNFDDQLANGKPWMVTLNAHYCQLTRELEHAFDKLAGKLHPDVSVGKIDGAVERGLLSRFQLRNLHAVYHINGTETRQYCEGHACEGSRLQTNQLVKFAQEGWRTQPPRTGCTSPVSRCGKAVGSITRLPAKFKSTYLHLHNDLQYSDLTLFAGLLAVPVVVGLSFICMLDAYFSRRPLGPPPTRPHMELARAAPRPAIRGCCTSASSTETADAAPERDARAQQQAQQQAPARKRRKIDPMTPPPPASEFPAWEPRDFFRFELLHTSKKSGARVGRIHTPHGIIDTPGFVAVGTNAALKAVDGPWADAEGQQLMFCNTYHLLLHPGADVVAAAGGLHAFMNRQRPLITDSGGFQVFSLAYGTVHEEVNSLKRGTGKSKHKLEHNLVAKIAEEGVTFRSYRDGTKMLLTPESSVQAQKQLGADIIIPLDELPPYHTEQSVLEASLQRSHRWMARSLKTHLADIRQQAMYGVVHGGLSLELRQRSIDYLTSLPFDGFAVGGSMGKNRADLFWLLEQIMPRLHERSSGKPVHILGIADPASIPQLVTYGCDTFDSCYPTRVGRHGTMLTKDGPLRVVSGQYKTAFRPPVEGCTCHTCRTHSLAYLHHLAKAREPLLASLLAIHNLHHMNGLMAQLRQQILDDQI